MSSSSDLETGITQQIIQKKSTSKKKKTKRTAVVAQEDYGRNEGDDPRWAYEPPEDARMLNHTVDVGVFEWDAIKDDEDTEIWLIRVPDSIKPKYLEGLEIDAPSSSRTARVGGLARKNTSYDVWSIGGDDAEVGGEELLGLACLLPRKKKDGKLYISPKRASKHIVISAEPPVPTASEHQPMVYQNPPRRSYPKDMLKHTFVPYGARCEQTHLSIGSDDIEITPEKPSDTTLSPKDKPAKAKPELKGKKRKVEVDLPKSSKKHKASI